MSSTSGITPTSSADLQKNFLNLMITQLRYQDPLNPTDNSQMTAQLAQLSQLEQLENMSTSFDKALSAQQMTYASDLIGKGVSFGINGQDAPVRGNVAAVTVNAGQPVLQVSDVLVPASSLISGNIDDPSALIGRMIGIHMPGQTDPVYGTIQNVETQNGQTMLRIGNLPVEPSAIQSIQSPLQ